MNKYSLSLEYLEYLSYSYTGSSASTKQTKLSSPQIIAPPTSLLKDFVATALLQRMRQGKVLFLKKTVDQSISVVGHISGFKQVASMPL